MRTAHFSRVIGFLFIVGTCWTFLVQFQRFSSNCSKKSAEHGAISLSTVGIWSQWKPKEWIAGNAGGEKAKTQKSPTYYTLQYSKCCEWANCMLLHVHRKCKKRTRTTEKRKISNAEFPMGTVAPSDGVFAGDASGKAPKVYRRTSVFHSFVPFFRCMHVCVFLSAGWKISGSLAVRSEWFEIHCMETTTWK